MQVRVVTDYVLKQISLDLSQCEAFAKSEVITGLDKNIILELFLDLRQLLSLASKNDWINYIEIYGKTPGKGAYSRVTPNQCMGLLKRLLESERRRTNFMQQMLNKDERDKRKYYEDIQRKLRELDAVGFVRT
ncbi:Exocyst complex component 6B [Cichlidogyrus casuarinus]|uniref:Exocyst complex component 6B n=1 Tax=Cichlidogyrus casuarinus TaxID=1844966 RepID=A0ABD2QHI8_9PLAT